MEQIFLSTKPLPPPLIAFPALQTPICTIITTTHFPTCLPERRKLLKFYRIKTCEICSESFGRGLSRAKDLNLSNVRITAILMA